MSCKVTAFSTNFTIKCRGKEVNLKEPCVMGILNLTPDSFYDGDYFMDHDKYLVHIERMVNEGASIIDVGAISTRPGATPVDEDTEIKRLIPALKKIRINFPEIIISVDTYRSNVAYSAIKNGADMINDISAGTYDQKMMDIVADSSVPYVMMHIQGRPENMQLNPNYDDIIKEIKAFFTHRIKLAQKAGIKQMIIDPGFGFGKTVQHNYTILKELNDFSDFKLPIMTGLSRKSLINRVLGIKSKHALNGTSVLNTIAILNGVNILRVHDVGSAMEVISLCKQYIMNPP